MCGNIKRRSLATIKKRKKSSLVDQKLLKRHVGYDFERTSRQHWFLIQLLILMFRSYLYYTHFLCHCQPKLSTYPRVWPPVKLRPHTTSVAGKFRSICKLLALFVFALPSQTCKLASLVCLDFNFF